MTIMGIDINAALADAEKTLKEDAALSSSARATMTLLLLVIQLLLDKLGMNSRNSSIPPSQDPNRSSHKKKGDEGNGDENDPSATKRKRGGQPGRQGTTLNPVDTPDDVQSLTIDPCALPPGTWKEVGFERRQVFDIRISRHITEYRAQILENEQGQRCMATFPEGITRPAQYGASIKAHAVYLSMYQLLPYERVQSMFEEQYNIPLSVGSLVNFNREAYEKAAPFEEAAKLWLRSSSVLHADETSLNINGKKWWLHDAFNSVCTLMNVAVQRGHVAMDEAGVLPYFQGTLVHDHWKPYYRYTCTHALCNAHHLRELTFAFEQNNQQWARHLHTLLLELNKAVTAAGGALSPEEAQVWRVRYRNILQEGELECPPPAPEPGQPRRGRPKRSKSRNLLERLQAYEDDALRFVEHREVPFTNNQGERDIRMTKVHQKISGCFRSQEGAQSFCRLRSYLSTCGKNGVDASEAMKDLFSGQWPAFLQEKMNELAAHAGDR
ncbi:MAG: IS66 family transposase [Pseudomonadales bacterium]|nr:IS66 family transposase [Pseudomonadales bacterium]